MAKEYPFVCRQCGKDELGWYRQQKYCSPNCRAASVRLPLGTECVMATPDGYEYLYVLVGHYKDGQHKWRPKAVIVIEKTLGISLQKRAYHRIRFRDGNFMNCDQNNIDLIDDPQYGECRDCHRSMYRPLKSDGTRPTLCPDCRPRVKRRDHGETGIKLTASQVLCIRERVRRGEQQKQLAIEFGVSKNCIHLIVHRKHWKHI